LPTSFNVEISVGLDSLVGDPNDVEEVVTKRKRPPARKQKNKKKMKWRPWGQGDNLILILMIIDKYICFILCFFHILLISYYVSFIFCSFYFNIDVLTCSCLFYYRMSKK
jgi:hypothetical protein